VLNEVHALLEDSACESRYIKRCDDATPADAVGVTNDSCPFGFNSDVIFHFFTTEAPCGDASMELLIASKTPEDAVPWALPIGPKDDPLTGVLPGRGYFSQLGAVRRKPSRADSEATMSKSCTDKLTMKQFTGLLSFPAYAFLRASTSCFIKSLVVYNHQFHEEGYRRAFGADGRLAPIADQGHFFNVDVLSDAFPDFEYSRVATGSGSKSSNVSALWIRGAPNQYAGISEVLHNGVKEGYKQFDARPSKASVVCRRSLWMMGQRLASTLSRSGKEAFSAPGDVACQLDSEMRSYREAKGKLAPCLRNQRKRIVAGCLSGWKVSPADDDWAL
jgi:tRNA-specific adenosine deaminase 1